MMSKLYNDFEADESCEKEDSFLSRLLPSIIFTLDNNNSRVGDIHKTSKGTDVKAFT